MNTSFLKFSDILSNYQICIDERIQRKYEWDEMKTIGLIDSINESALSYKDDYVSNECKKDIGTMLAFEIPMEETTDKTKRSYYMDEGNQRLMTIIIIFKAIFAASESYKLENDGVEVLTHKNKVLLLDCIENFKNNFVPENQKEIYSYLMNSSDLVLKKYTNTKIVKAYNAAVEVYKSVIDNGVEEFNDIIQFLINDLGCNITFYRPTSLKVRQQKYNALNTSIKEQSKLHRAYSTLNELSSIVEYNSFSNDVHRYEKIAKEEYGIQNIERFFTLYYYIKCVHALGSDINGLNASINVLAQKVRTCGKYSYEFFNTFFDEFEILCSLCAKRIKWDVIDTYENRRIGALLTSIIDLFIKHPRQSTAVYYLKVLTDCFDIKNKCIITGVKPFINKQKLIKLLSQIFVYKICIDCQASNNSASDERSTYTLLIKENAPFSNEILDSHYQHLAPYVDMSMKTSVYKDLLYRQKYNSKGIRLILSIVASEGDDFDDILRHFIKIYYSFNEYDIDHVIAQIMGGDDNVANLRMRPKMDNRCENKFDNNERFIDNDCSFPENMRNTIFSEDSLQERYEWMTLKIHNFINNILM